MLSTNSQHEKEDLRQFEINVGLNLLKVGYPTLRHKLYPLKCL